MAKRKTKKDIREELVEDIKQVIIQKDGAVEVGTKEILPTEKPVKKIKAPKVLEEIKVVVTPVKVAEVIEKVILEPEDQLTTDIKIAINLVNPKNVVAIPLVYKKFVALTKLKHNKKFVFAEIRRLISKK